MAANDEIVTVLKKFNMAQVDLDHLRQAGELLGPELDDFVQDWYEWLRGQQEYQHFFGANPDSLGRIQRLQLDHWRAFFSGIMDQRFAESRRYIGAVHARIDLPNDIYLAGVSVSVTMLIEPTPLPHSSAHCAPISPAARRRFRGAGWSSGPEH